MSSSPPPPPHCLPRTRKAFSVLVIFKMSHLLSSWPLLTTGKDVTHKHEKKNYSREILPGHLSPLDSKWKHSFLALRNWTWRLSHTEHFLSVYGFRPVQNLPTVLLLVSRQVNKKISGLKSGIRHNYKTTKMWLYPPCSHRVNAMNDFCGNKACTGIIERSPVLNDPLSKQRGAAKPHAEPLFCLEITISSIVQTARLSPREDVCFIIVVK